MPWSHHSHSGQFCGHATNTLEEVVQDAIKQGMTTFCLTEHIARSNLDLYPEEGTRHDQESLTRLYDAFYHEARRLQRAYAAQIQLFVGFEGEWIRSDAGPWSSQNIIEALLAKYRVDVFVGSVHHVHTHPIDYDTALYHLAREAAGGTDERLFCDYFDAQLEMLKALRPPVVGHFDLIRLKSDDPDRGLRSYGSGVWERVERNLKFVAGYGGVLELNSAALRKGLAQPYPEVEVCRAFVRMGGRSTLSDDSHGVAQVGAEYGRVMEFVERAGIAELWCLAAVEEEEAKALPLREGWTGMSPLGRWKAVPVAEVRGHGFWAKQGV